jgi:Glycosyl hydrolase family 26
MDRWMGKMSRKLESGTDRKSPRHFTSSKYSKIRSLWLILAVVPLLLFEATNVSAHAEPMSAATPKLYFGLIYPQTPDITALASYETLIGKGVSLVLWYQSWEEGNQLQPFPSGQMEAVREHGAIPVLAWYPDSYPGSADQPQFSLAKIAGGAFDSYLRQYAEEVKAWGHPLFLRFASEMNGNWVPWSEFHSGNSAGQFVQAWRHVHDIFKSVGATNVTWAWCPNTEDAYTTPLEDLYPGNAYVDWAGLDGYNFYGLYGAPWQSFSQIFSETYNHLLRLIPRSMPIMIGETGSVEQGGSKPGWITDALTTQLPAHFTHIKALVWFDSVDSNLDLRVNTSPQSLRAFKQAIASNNYASNNYSSLNQSPIPVPEKVVLPAAPTPAPTTFATGTTGTGVPISVNFLSGPAPGTVQILNAQNNNPVPKATVHYKSGVTTLTDSNGVTRLPSKIPNPVLTTIAVGSVVFHIQQPLDLQRGYTIFINLATGKATQVIVHIVVNPLLVVILFALLLLIVIVLRAFFRRRSQRRGRKAKVAEPTRRERAGSVSNW